MQTQILKTLINCPRSTSPAVVRLFCGTEPLACRLEILKLRYFWRKLNGPADAISTKILKHRRDRFLECSRGFAHDVFNICIKYNTMPTWHGLAPPGKLNRILNPLQYFKRTIISHNLRSDLEEGRNRNNFFSKNFLSNPFRYQKNYHIIQPFSQANCFSSPNGRKRFIKALLHPCSYLDNCTLCSEQTSDICNHLLTTCPRTPDLRKKLRLKLTLYNYPANHLPVTKSSIIENSLSNKLWRKCFADFLVEVDY